MNVLGSCFLKSLAVPDARVYTSLFCLCLAVLFCPFAVCVKDENLGCVTGGTS